ncbi:MAG: SRPBCC domain-containing protein, partial [Chloroflexota bacterium]|nr:SRPBCC domain-containing protein [Chloroflexota bacterium]
MKIKSKHEFKCCDRDQVWDKLTDIELLGSIIIDGKGLKKVGKNRYKGALPLKMPAIEGKLAATFKLEKMRKPKSFRLHVKGKNGAIRVSSKGIFKLSKRPKGSVRYDGRLNL